MEKKNFLLGLTLFGMILVIGTIGLSLAHVDNSGSELNDGKFVSDEHNMMFEQCKRMMGKDDEKEMGKEMWEEMRKMHKEHHNGVDIGKYKEGFTWWEDMEKMHDDEMNHEEMHIHHHGGHHDSSDDNGDEGMMNGGMMQGMMQGMMMGGMM